MKNWSSTKTKQCKTCAKDFVIFAGRCSYCSVECREEYSKIKRQNEINDALNKIKNKLKNLVDDGFKEHPTISGLYCNKDGEMWSVAATMRGPSNRIHKLKTSVNNSGYLQCGISRDYQFKVLLLHRVVYETFKGVTNKSIGHKDGNKQNNNIDNLVELKFDMRHQ